MSRHRGHQTIDMAADSDSVWASDCLIKYTKLLPVSIARRFIVWLFSDCTMKLYTSVCAHLHSIRSSYCVANIKMKMPNRRASHSMCFCVNCCYCCCGRSICSHTLTLSSSRCRRDVVFDNRKLIPNKDALAHNANAHEWMNFKHRH